MKTNEIVKGRTESHDPIWNHKGKNRNPKCPYTYVNAVILWREEQKVITLHETVKGRTESHNPMWNHKGKNRNPKSPYTHKKQWNCKGKNRKSWPYMKSWREEQGSQKPIHPCATEKGRTETQYPCTHVSMKGRTETQDPILAMNLRKGRTETQNPYTLKKKKKKKEKETHGLIL